MAPIFARNFPAGGANEADFGQCRRALIRINAAATNRPDKASTNTLERF